MKRFLMALVGGLMFTGAAHAAEALVTADLNMRSSPSARGSIIETIPAGALVDVRRCRSGNQWCRINWNGQRGWSNADGLAFHEAPFNTDDMVDAAMTAGAAVAGAILVENNIYRYGRDNRPRYHNRKTRSYRNHKKYNRYERPHRVYRYGRKDFEHRAHRDERRYKRDYRRKKRSHWSDVGPGPKVREQSKRNRDARRNHRRNDREARRDHREHKAYRHDRRKHNKHKKRRSYRSSIPVN